MSSGRNSSSEIFLRKKKSGDTCAPHWACIGATLGHMDGKMSWNKKRME